MFDVRTNKYAALSSTTVDTLNTTNNEQQQLQDDCYRELVMLAKTIGEKRYLLNFFIVKLFHVKTLADH